MIQWLNIIINIKYFAVELYFLDVPTYLDKLLISNVCFFCRLFVVNITHLLENNPIVF